MLADSGPVCETYTEAEVDCQGIYGETPSCTLYNLQGQSYFATITYNVQDESDYTGELSGFYAPDVVFSSNGQSSGSSHYPEEITSLQQVYILLLK